MRHIVSCVVVSLSVMSMAGPSLAQTCATGNPNITYDSQSETWTVTSNGGDDTASIQCALTSAAGVDGSTVVLDGATFHVVNGIGVAGFDGQLRGSSSTTTVRATGVGQPANMRSIFFFDGQGGTAGARVSDLAIHVPDGASYQAPTPSAAGLQGAALFFFENSGASVTNVSITTDNEDYQNIFAPVRHLDRAIVSDSCYDAVEIAGSYFSQIGRTVYSASRTQVPETRRCAFTLADNDFVNVRNTFYFLGIFGASAFPNNSDFLVEGNYTENAWGSWLPLIGDGATVTVIDNTFIDSAANGDIYIENTASPSYVAGNYHEGGSYGLGGIALINASNAEVRDNTFVDIVPADAEQPGSAAVLIRNTTDSVIEGNNYRRSGQPAWEIDPDPDPEAFSPFSQMPLIWIDEVDGTTAGTLVREFKFGPSRGRGTMLCAMVYADDVAAEIHHWQACD